MLYKPGSGPRRGEAMGLAVGEPLRGASIPYDGCALANQRRLTAAGQKSTTGASNRAKVPDSNESVCAL